MEYLIVCLVALLASGLTLFSGFGLGTILMPAFAIFFPVPVAVAATALVHLANNLFKLWLVGASANRQIVIRFSIPAVLAAFVGAFLLNYVADLPVLVSYQIGERVHEITALKLVIGLIIAGFSFLELLPRFAAIAIDQKYIGIGGLLSGFFGGLSGHQGALRSMFLIKAGLKKEEFIGTNVVSAVIVDCARLLVYGAGFYTAHSTILADSWQLVLAASAAAFLGAFWGKELLKKVTLRAVQVLVGIMLVLLGLALAAGVI
jgi:uncharacterized membrane protein YfcA